MRKILSLIFLIIFASNNYAQNQRPKIGLVLSGGGAKGMAHVGVLKTMEEAGLTPDYITGTSMGSIVGGLYSIGYTADELAVIISEADWDLLLTNTMPLNKVAFEEKFYYGRYLLDFYIKDKKLQLPKGVIEGQALMELFSDLTRPIHGINDFNKFPIPFACIGTDIVTGEAVVLNKGSLAKSMRASMSIPTVFTPVKIDDHLLVDGGIVRNMPVDEVIEMGADIVIGVFVGEDFTPEEDLNSAIDILTQVAFISAVLDSRKEMAKCDILIKPNLEGFTTASFQSAAEIVERGAVAGKKYSDVFKNLADSLKKIEPLHKVIKPVVRNDYIFTNIQITGNSIIPDKFIIGKLGLKLNEPIDITKIDKQIEYMYGTHYFEKVWFEILSDNDRYVLKVHVDERPKTELRFAYHYDTENRGGIIGNITFRNLILNRSKLILEANMATHPSMLLDYFKYIGKKQYFAIGATSVFNKNELPYYDSIGNTTDVFHSNFGAASVKLQLTKLQNSTMGVEVLWSKSSINPKLSSSAIIKSLTKVDYNHFIYKAFYSFNSYNERYYPTRGFKSNIDISTTSRIYGKVVLLDSITIDAEDLGEFMQTDPIVSLNFEVMPIIPISKKVSIISKARIKLSSIQKSSLNLTEYDYVGGFVPGLGNSNEYMGVGIKEFVVANYFFGNIGVQYTPIRNLYLQAHFNYLDTEYPTKWLNPNADIGKLGDRYRRYSYGGVIAYKSPIGPISIAVAKDHFRSGVRASFMIGFHY